MIGEELLSMRPYGLFRMNSEVFSQVYDAMPRLSDTKIFIGMRVWRHDW